MYIRINKRRLALKNTCTEDEIFRLVSSKLYWPKIKAFVEWGEGHVVEIQNDDELRLASRMISEELYSEAMSYTADFREIEQKVEAHMLEPDSDPEPTVNSEDDMTMEDFYMMGFRHEILN